MKVTQFFPHHILSEILIFDVSKMDQYIYIIEDFMQIKLPLGEKQIYSNIPT